MRPVSLKCRLDAVLCSLLDGEPKDYEEVIDWLDIHKRSDTDYERRWEQSAMTTLRHLLDQRRVKLVGLRRFYTDGTVRDFFGPQYGDADQDTLDRKAHDDDSIVEDIEVDDEEGVINLKRQGTSEKNRKRHLSLYQYTGKRYLTEKEWNDSEIRRCDRKIDDKYRHIAQLKKDKAKLEKKEAEWEEERQKLLVKQAEEAARWSALSPEEQTAELAANEAKIAKKAARKAKEEARFAALTPEEQAAELQAKAVKNAATVAKRKKTIAENKQKKQENGDQENHPRQSIQHPREQEEGDQRAGNHGEDVQE